MTVLLIFFGKLFSRLSQQFGLGNGSTWPGHVALKIQKNFIKTLLQNTKIKVILVAGTNGKTTTTKMLQTIFPMQGKKLIQNPSGANLLNGVASGLLMSTNTAGKLSQDVAIFEVDENTLPQLLTQVTPTYLILLNLFRDQLDRYGEVNIISKNWKNCVEKLTNKTTLILNADDPQIAYIGKNTKARILYFGLNEKQENTFLDENTADSSYCPNCGSKLFYKNHFFSHLGEWYCKHCKFERPSINLPKTSFYPLEGTYNKYNTLAAVLVAKNYGFSEKDITAALKTFTPAFGRQEKVKVGEKYVSFFLSKNPTGFNESIKTIQALEAKTVILLLNDNVADGRDISWIWDIRTELLVSFAKKVIASGTRAADMGLRLKYSMDSLQTGNSIYEIQTDIKEAVKRGLDVTKNGETLYLLPTYTAMLEARKLITGKKIL